jgi:hypothetical protein
MLKTTRFSDTLIRMTDYGSSGMPKIVVLGGGTAHKVYYNANDSVNNIALHDSIISALAPNVIEENNAFEFYGRIVPNPANASATLILNIVNAGDYSVELVDPSGRIVSVVYYGMLETGEQRIHLNTSDLTNSVYQIRVLENNKLAGTLMLLKFQ